ncbi:MAG: LysM peptidoglycan-binding domain-containing protein [Anaerolineae bacterium]
MRRSLVVLASTALVVSLSWGVLAQQSGGVTIYVVQRGDTLFRIAQTYDVTFQEIARVNGLSNPNSIDVGDRLLIPLAGETLPQIHYVQAGETLDAIAALYGVTAADLQGLNQLDSASIYVGQALAIGSAPQAEPPVVVVEAPAVDSSAPTVIHSVSRGETLFRIAQAYGVTMNSIVQANGLADPELIYPGQMLVIPGVEAPQLAAGLPAAVSSFNVTPLSLLQGRTGEFRLQTNGPASVTGAFLNQQLQFATEPDGTTSIAMIGVPLDVAPGIYPVTVIVSDSTGGQYPISANVQVNAGDYDEGGSIRVTGDAAVLLNPAVEQQELDMVRSLMSRFTPERMFDGAFGLPAAATITSGFGSTRTYTGGEQRVHTGTDFGAAPGAPVMAAASGRVVMVDNLNIRGLATIIDHGWGIYTGYWHQSESYVSPGDYVQEGQVIGAVGSSGRVSGPHLHWELWVNGVPVDPMQWVVQDFS